MSKSKILVVDDSPTVLQTISQALREAGYEVLNARDGQEAIEVVEKEKPQVVVLDILLPKKSGFQVCRQLKRAESSPVKVLMLSSKSQDSDRLWGEKQGADAYLTKPFEMNQLIDQVAQLEASSEVADAVSNQNK